jgi:hypothetical protein
MEKKNIFSCLCLKNQSFSLSKRSLLSSNDLTTFSSKHPTILLRHAAAPRVVSKPLELPQPPWRRQRPFALLACMVGHTNTRAQTNTPIFQQQRASKSASSKLNLLVFSPFFRGFFLAEIGALWD